MSRPGRGRAQGGGEASYDGGVLGGALDDAEGYLGPIYGDAERAHHGVSGEVEPVDEADQSLLVIQGPERNSARRSAVAAMNRRLTEDCDVPDAEVSTSSPTGSRAVW